MMNKKIKVALCKTIVSITIIANMLSFAGCSGGTALKNFMQTDVADAMASRARANIQIAERLKASHFISEDVYNSIVASINEQVKVFQEVQVEVDSNGNLKSAPFADSIVSVRPLGIQTEKSFNYDGNYQGVTGTRTPSYIIDDDGNKIEGSTIISYKLSEYYIISNYLVSPHAWNVTSSDGFRLDQKVNNIQHVPGENMSPINNTWQTLKRKPSDDAPDGIKPAIIVKADYANDLNEMFKFNVWVLRPDIQTVDGCNSIDGIMETVKGCVDGKSDEGNLQKYFVQARSSTGEPITLLNNPEDYNIIRNSETNTDPNVNVPGKDMVISQYGEPVLTVRFSEFSQEVVDKLDNIVGFNPDKYLFSTLLANNNAGTKNVYLLEYPISYLESLENYTENGEDKIVGHIEKSGLGINLLTGSLIKYEKDGSGNWTAKGTKIAESADQYLTVAGADDNNSTGKSSFILKGQTTTTLFRAELGEPDIEITCGRIILRDYLESTYAPGFETGDNSDIAVFGRKMRLRFPDDWRGTDTLEPYWERGAEAAYFIDKDGNEIANSPKLAITDFCSLSYDSSTNEPICNRLYRKGETGQIIESQVKDGEVPTISKIKCISNKSVIHPTTMFPSESLGTQDYASDSEEKQRFYCLMTTKGLFDSSLFSSWIESTSTTASLDWWNKYLGDNKFVYRVDHIDVNDYLVQNYTYELQQNGITILDLETVAKIQEMYDKEDAKGITRFIRTIFIILGYTLIAIAPILMMLWLIDTSTDLGLNLLERVTFGNWVAIKYADDIPDNKLGEKTYMSGGKMATKCFILIAIGIVLVKIDIIYIVKLLVGTFGRFAGSLEKLIKGLK